MQLILSVPWLSLEKKGAIFTVEGEPGLLLLKAQLGLPADLCSMCNRVPFGRCLCGLAAESRRPVFAGSLDARHTTRYSEIREHGHYVVPIRRGEQVEGVLCTYLAPGHEREERELEFLEAIASALAGVLIRRRAEDERRRAQERLADARRLESPGRRAPARGGGQRRRWGGARLRQHPRHRPWGGVLIRHLSTGGFPHVTSAVEALLRATKRGSELTRKLMEVGREGAPAPATPPLLLDDALRDMRGTLQHLLGEGVELRLETAAAGARISIERGDLERVLLNLAANARDAMPSGGRLTVRTTRRAPGRVELEIADTGSGMPPEIRDLIFEPFFTTKPQGKGTGLGLPTVLHLVRGAGGEVELETQAGAGTSFRLTFACAGNDPQ